MKGSMKVVRFPGAGAVRLESAPIPEAKGDEVVVEVKAAAICGTDRENLEGPGQAAVPGHECAGVVVNAAGRVRPGARVAINCHVTCGACEHCLRGDLYFCERLRVIGFDLDGGFAQYLVVPESCCMPLPDDLGFETGALLADMVGTSYRAVKRGAPLPADRVAVWGAGPIGLATLMVLRMYGVRVAVVDLSPLRLQMARHAGAELTLHGGQEDVSGLIAEWTGGGGLDVAFECVGAERAAHQALASLRKRGRLVVVGVSHALTLDPWKSLICRELTIVGTRNFNTAEYDEMVALVRRGLAPERAVTHRFPLARAEEAFAVFRSGDCGKVLLTG